MLNVKPSVYLMVDSEPLCNEARNGHPSAALEDGFSNHKCTDFVHFYCLFPLYLGLDQNPLGSLLQLFFLNGANANWMTLLFPVWYP